MSVQDGTSFTEKCDPKKSQPPIDPKTQRITKTGVIGEKKTTGTKK